MAARASSPSSSALATDHHQSGAKESPFPGYARPNVPAPLRLLGRRDLRRRGCPLRQSPSKAFPADFRRPYTPSIDGLGLFIMLMQIFSGFGAEAGNRASGLLLEHLPVSRARGRRLSAHRTLGFTCRHVPLHRRHDRHHGTFSSPDTEPTCGASVRYPGLFAALIAVEIAAVSH